MTDYESELEMAKNELAVVEIELQHLQKQKCDLLEKIAELKAIVTQQDQCKVQRSCKIWEGTDFPWTQKLEEVLKDVFRLSSLRPMQRQTMNATLSKEDCFLIMPTGGGKSLCFQLPAMVDKGLTLVVSPLVSLMEDQQIALEQLGIPSAMLNAATSKNDLKDVQDDMIKPNGELKLLYVTPEKLAKSKRFMNRLEKCYEVGHLARIVIDEVHCCSQWGHDFRPDYKFLGIMKRQFPNTPILGLTATATIKVLEDVKKILNIPKALLFKASFNRPNLYFEVSEKPSAQKDVMDVIHRLISTRFSGQSGIVYCFSRKDSEEITTELQSRGIKAGCYNADRDAKSRSLVHRRWLSGDIQVVIATVAFGMGIDKPDVRFVIHHSLSKSMENLYQESGRAGRDEKRSDCILFYRLADVARQSSMVFTEMTGLQNLHGIVRYCIDVGSCRRSIIARHFGEEWDSSQCNNMCDHCDKARNTGPIENKDITKYCADVLSILQAAADTDQRITNPKLIDAWYGRGHASLKVKSVAVPSFGRETAERIIAHMIANGYLQEDFHFTAYNTISYIVPGPKAKLLQNNVVKVYMDFKAKSSVKSQMSSSATSRGTTSAQSSSPAITTSTSSADSPIPLVKKTVLSSASKVGRTKEKPKLVIVNKEKLYLNDSALSVSTPSHKGTTTKNSLTHSGSKSTTKKTAADMLSKTKVLEKDGLNFDDDDEGNFKPRPQIARKTKREPDSDCKIVEVKEETVILNHESISENGRKKKFPIDDDFDIDDSDRKKRRLQQTFDEADIKAPVKKARAIVISDEDSD